MSNKVYELIEATPKCYRKMIDTDGLPVNPHVLHTKDRMVRHVIARHECDMFVDGNLIASIYSRCDKREYRLYIEYCGFCMLLGKATKQAYASNPEPILSGNLSEETREELNKLKSMAQVKSRVPSGVWRQIQRIKKLEARLQLSPQMELLVPIHMLRHSCCCLIDAFDRLWGTPTSKEDLISRAGYLIEPNDLQHYLDKFGVQHYPEGQLVDADGYLVEEPEARPGMAG